MDVLDKILNQAKRLPQDKISQGLCWLLIVYGLYLTAQLTWDLFPSKNATTPWQPTVTTVNNNTSDIFSIQNIEQLSLFGKVSTEPKKAPPPPPKPVLTDAPKTTLSIQLVGVVASTAEQNGLAIIESRGNQETYSLDDKITGTSALLKEVYADRIIISNNGRYETLMLDGLAYTTDSSANDQLQQAAKTTKASQVDQRDNAEISAQLEESRAALLADPSKITDFLAISPVKQNGGITGYRLNAGKDKSLFTSAGFKANDLAKSINGYDLTDMGQSLEVMGQLSELTEVSIMVERQGQLIEILLSLPQN